jgi:16S rRNA (cytosine1402-N4)-methyltransferase
MPRELLEFLQPRSGRLYVDGTVGLGGHAAAMLAASDPDGRLIGLDRDAEALAQAAAALARFGARVTLVQDSFARLPERLKQLGIESVDGIVLDLGVSSYQLEAAERGFSFQRTGPLDMRMDRSAPRTAADLIREASEHELERIIHLYGEERFARRYARAIARRRREAPIATTSELEAVIWRATPPARRHGRIHPATRVFQALRIVVNDELDHLERALERLPDLLAPGGRLCVIAFHSLEDRSVKLAFRARRQRAGFRIVTPKPVTPDATEVESNPRARSAKLRVLERLQEEAA